MSKNTSSEEDESKKKISYREVPKAMWFALKILWGISPLYVIATALTNIKERIIPFITIFIVASITSKLPGLVEGSVEFTEVLRLAVLAVIIELATRGLDVILANIIAKKSDLVEIGLSENLITAFAKLPYHLYEDKEVVDSFEYAGTFIYRFGRFGINQSSRAVGSLLEFIIATVGLFAVAWFLPILMIIFLPILIKSFLGLNEQIAKTFKWNRPDQRQIWAIERFFLPRQIKETRIYGIVEHLATKRRKLMESMHKRDYKIQKKRNILSFWQQVQAQFIELISIGVALYKIAYQGSPLGIFVLAQQLTSRATNSVEAFFKEVIDMDEDLYGFAEYRYITEELVQQSEATKKIDSPVNISIENLSFAYPNNNKLTLKAIDLNIKQNQKVAIVGVNGAGKSTLIKLILGLYLPSEGSIKVNNLNLSDYDQSSWLSKIGVLIQDFGMLEDITIREAVWLGNISKPKDDEAIYDVLDQVGLKKYVLGLPYRLDSYLGKWIDPKKGTELSGGQLQRLALARALFRDPEVLILDEPTSSVDAIAEEEIFEKLMITRANKITIFISHRFSTVRRAEEIVVLDKGRVVESGSHKELMESKGLYQEMFSKQSKAYLE